jgi:hypothetical protein
MNPFRETRTTPLFYDRPMPAVNQSLRRPGERVRQNFLARSPMPVGKGDGSILPERPFGCFAQNTPVPFSLVHPAPPRVLPRHEMRGRPVRKWGFESPGMSPDAVGRIPGNCPSRDCILWLGRDLVWGFFPTTAQKSPMLDFLPCTPGRKMPFWRLKRPFRCKKPLARVLQYLIALGLVQK